MKNSRYYTIFLLMVCSVYWSEVNAKTSISSDSIQQTLSVLEKRSKGRLGVFAINTADDTHIAYRADELFPMGCTSKVIGVGAVLKKSMTHPRLLQEREHYTKKQLIAAEWTPITSKHLSTGMTIGELCGAAITHSDNLAMNLLVKKMGGLSALNTFAKSIGNDKFRVDHM